MPSSFEVVDDEDDDEEDVPRVRINVANRSATAFAMKCFSLSFNRNGMVNEEADALEDGVVASFIFVLELDEAFDDVRISNEDERKSSFISSFKC